MSPALRRVTAVLAALAGLSQASSSFAGSAVVFSTDFSGGIPPEFSAPGSEVQAVQGYTGLGSPGRQFAGTFLRYTSVPLYPTTLTLTNLPPHDHLSVKFLLGIIDSWDGTELMQVSVDGAVKFNHWFQLAVGDTTDYFPAPAGSILSMSRDLGFSGCCYYNRDRAYDLGADPAFLDIPHTASSVDVTWSISAISGPAADQWQGADDESWAIDAVSVEISGSTVGVGDEPKAGSLAIRAVPNPSRDGALRFGLFLPGPGAARVGLLDLAGRRVAVRETVGQAGYQELDLTKGRRLAPGLYLARLSVGARERTTRVVVTR